MTKGRIIGLLSLVSVLTASAGFGVAQAKAEETNITQYKLNVGNFAYGVYTSVPTETLWWGAPNNQNAYVNSDNVVSPGNDYATAICFTAPCDGVISPKWGLGTASRVGQQTATTDGVRFSAFLNDRKIFPANGLWAEVPQQADYNGDGTNDSKLEIYYEEQTVKAGDKLYYILDNGGNGNSDWDMSYLLMGFCWIDEAHPDGIWYDSDAGYWTDEESGEVPCPNFTYKKSELTSYHYLSVREYKERAEVETENKQVGLSWGDFEFTELNGTPLWSGAPATNAYCYVAGNLFVPCQDYSAGVCFTAPCDGRIVNGLGGGTFFRNGEDNERTDKARISVIHENTVVYPYTGVWADVPQGLENAQELSFNSIEVKAGEKLWYVVDCGGNDNSEWDIVQLDAGFLWVDENNPNGVYVDFSQGYWTDKTTGNQPVSFGNYPKKSVFSYHYVVVKEANPVGEAVEIESRETEISYMREKLGYSQTQKRYYKLDDSNQLVYSDFCVPGDYYMLGIVWKAPADGRVDISQTTIQNYYYQSTPNVDGIRSDGVRVKIMLGKNKEIYPKDGEWFVINNSAKYAVNLQPFAVNQGEELLFLLDRNGECNYDNCKMDITVCFAETGAQYTETYNNITDFDKESENADRWSYYAYEVEKQDEGGDRVVNDLLVVTYSQGGCSSGLTGGFTLSLVGLVGGTICIAKRRWKKEKDKKGDIEK